MIKNLTVSSSNNLIKKKNVHRIVGLLKKELNFSIFALEINFVSNDFLLEINKKYLNHNYYTDIITFNYSKIADNLEGELFISYDEALENSKKYNCSHHEELLRLVIHGILHLLGYDDIRPEDKKKMKKLENFLVEKFSSIENINII